jgi:hypothetical protein
LKRDIIILAWRPFREEDIVRGSRRKEKGVVKDLEWKNRERMKIGILRSAAVEMLGNTHI